MSQYNIIAENNGSRLRQNRRLPGGRNRSFHLPFPAMSFHISPFAVDYPKVTSDKNGLAELFLTDYCKALPCALK